MILMLMWAAIIVCMRLPFLERTHFNEFYGQHAKIIKFNSHISISFVQEKSLNFTSDLASHTPVQRDHLEIIEVWFIRPHKPPPPSMQRTKSFNYAYGWMECGSNLLYALLKPHHTFGCGVWVFFLFLIKFFIRQHFHHSQRNLNEGKRKKTVQSPHTRNRFHFYSFVFYAINLILCVCVC